MRKSTIFTIFMILLLLLTASIPKAMAIAFPIVSLILYLCHCTPRDFQRYKNVPLASLVILIFCGLSILWSSAPELSTDRVIKLSGLFLGGSLFSIWVKKAYLEEGMILTTKNLKYIAGTIIFISAYFIFELLAGAQIYLLTHPGALSDPQGFSTSVFNRGIIIIALSTIPIATLLFKHNESAWALALSISVLATIFISESQTIQLGVIFFLLIYGVYKITKRDLRKLIYICIPLGFISLPLVFPYIYEQKPEYLLAVLEKAYPMQRLELWSNVSNAIQEKPLLGYGIETIREHRFDMGDEYFKTEYTPHPHNAFLQIWYEFGLLGVLFFTTLIICPFIRFKGCHFRTRSWAYSFYLCILFTAFVSYGLWQSWWIGTLYFLLSLARLTIYQMEHTTHKLSSQKTTPSA